MNYKNIIYKTSEKITTITINRPKKLNALNILTIDELHEALKFAEGDSDTKVIIITGSEQKSFVAGADISEFCNFSKSEGYQLSVNGHIKLFDFIEKLKKPVIAAINGYALGGGLELAMSCHIRIASENSRMGLPEVSLGVNPGYGGTQRLPQLIGKGRAMELIMTASMIDSKRAYEIGLINHVVSQQDLLPFCLDLANKIKVNSSSAISSSIRAINANYVDGENGYETENSLFGDCFKSPDFVEGTAAFLEKRKANFN